MISTDKDKAAVLPCGRRRPALVEQRGLGLVMGRRENPRAVARFEVKSPLVGIPSRVEPDSCL
jgi:hypothetical protein